MVVTLLEYDLVSRELSITVQVDGVEEFYVYTGISGWPASDGGHWDYDRGDATVWNACYESIQRFLDREVPSEAERHEIMYG